MTAVPDPAVTPPASPPPTRSRSRGWLAILSLAALMTGLLALSPLAPASADGSFACTNGTATEVPLVQGEVGGIAVPLYLAVESYTLTGEPGAGICYGTAQYPQPEVVGGYNYAYTRYEPDNRLVLVVGNESDSNTAGGFNYHVVTTPHFTVTPGGPSGGQEISFVIPASVCTGPVCYPPNPNDANIGTTGLIVGTIQQTPTSTGGTSASYSVSRLCVMVDGVPVFGCTTGFGDTGVTTTGTGPVTSAPAEPGPCVLTACAPDFTYIGTTGTQIATVYVPGLGPIPVYGVHTCLYRNSPSVQCPA